MLSIRTQGRRNLLPYSRIDIVDGFTIYSKGEKSLYYNDFDFDKGMWLMMDSKILGVYRNATRALEVLDEIQEAILSQTKQFIDENELVFKTIHSVVVYQMPKE